MNDSRPIGDGRPSSDSVASPEENKAEKCGIERRLALGGTRDAENPLWHLFTLQQANMADFVTSLKYARPV